MRDTITISLPAKDREALDRAAEADGVSRSDIVRESMRDYLFVREFRSLRRELLPHAGALGVYTDQDVFDRIS
jgi:metal-responsive CopG/Arc/MetJ family transcriptional regulator